MLRRRVNESETRVNGILLFLELSLSCHKTYSPHPLRNKVVSIVESHGAQFTVELCKALYTGCIIPYKEQHRLRVCYDLYKKHPEQLMMMDPPQRHMIHNEDDDAMIAVDAAAVERFPNSKAQVKEFGSDAKDLGKCIIMSYAHIAGTIIKKFDNLGYVKSYVSVQNNPERLRCLTNKVEFSQSIIAIAVLGQQDVVRAKAALAKELRAMASK
jgi:hypothetical protein